MTSPVPLVPDEDSIPDTAGLAKLARLIYSGADPGPIIAELSSRASTNPEDAGALMDLSMIVQLAGDRTQGLAIQSLALESSRLYRCVHGSGTGLRVLALQASGDFMANTPLDFLFDGADATVHYAYLPDNAALPAPLPDHDIAFMGVAESDANRDLLQKVAEILVTFPKPVINGDARLIVQIARDRLWKLFQSSSRVLAPRNARVNRAELTPLATNIASLGALLPDAHFPILVRPVDSHAGHGLGKINDPADLSAYLAASGVDDFYIVPYIDYRSRDNRFRKYRIVFIDRAAYLAHLAISDDWMVHYLNAGMHESADKRDEEAGCMAHFDDDFATRHRIALGEIASKVGLDYFAVDCAETQDGRILVFEGGTGMIVHAMDPADLFPYKQIQMRKIFHAFAAMLERRVGDASHFSPDALH